MFRVSQHPSSGALKTVTAASGTGHNTGTVTSLQRGLASGTGHNTGTATSVQRGLASVTGHNTGTATSLQSGLIRPLWREVAVAVL